MSARPDLCASAPLREISCPSIPALLVLASLREIGCLSILALCVALGIGGCAGGGEVPCRFGTDCPSGVCRADGVCEPLEGDDAGAIDGGTARDAGGEGDAGTEPPDGGVDEDGGVTPPDAGPPGCGDGDGVIARSELSFPIGEALAFRVAEDAAVDSHGAERPSGERIWDFEGPYADDSDRSFVRRDPAGEWYGEAFPGASYSLPLSGDESLLGVFEVTDDAVLLLGVVSETDGFSRTELAYDPPMPVWQLPLALEATWSETSTVSGLASGVSSFYTERWTMEVDASGQVGTPAGTHEVLRVNTRITRTVGALVTITRRHAYVAECLGTVAQLFGRDNDTDAEPSVAGELWRVR